MAESAAGRTAAQLSVALTNRVEAEEKTNAKTDESARRDVQESRDAGHDQAAAEDGVCHHDRKELRRLHQDAAAFAGTGDGVERSASKKMAVGADLGIEMMSGDLTPEQRADLTKRIKADTDAIAARLKTSGTDAYAAYETYEKTIPDRMAVSPTLKGQCRRTRR